MAEGSPDPGRIVIDGKTYFLAKDGSVFAYQTTSGEDFVEKWSSFGGSMGETVRKTLDGIYFGTDFDTSDGTIRLSPLVTTVVSDLDIAYSPVSFWEDWDSDGDRAVYLMYRDTSTTPDVIIKKIRVSDDTVVDTETSVAAAAATVPFLGKAISFEGATYVPDGGFSGTNVLRKLATVGDVSAGTADTWENADSGVHASSCELIQEEGTTKFIRATGGNYHTAAAEPKTSGNYAGPFQVGDDNDNAGVTWTVASGELAYFARSDNLYSGDGQGTSRPVLDFQRELTNKAPIDYDDVQGHMSASVGAAILYPSTVGVRRYITPGGPSDELGIDAIPGYRAVPNTTTIPIRLRHYAVVTFGRHVYAVYKPTGHATNSAGTCHIMYGFYENNRRITWRPFISRAVDILGLFIDSDLRLWWVENPQDPADIPGTPTADVQYTQLAADGSPRTALGSNRGRASTLSTMYLPEVRYDEVVQLRMIKIEMEGLSSDSPVQVAILRDGATAETVGATITSDGWTERILTVGTTDTCDRARVRIAILTTAGYNASSSDLRILRLHLIARSPDTIRVVLTNKDDRSKRSLFEMKKILRKLKDAGRYTVSEPGTNETFTATITAVNDITHEGNPAVGITMSRWNVAA